MILLMLHCTLNNMTVCCYWCDTTPKTTWPNSKQHDRMLLLMWHMMKHCALNKKTICFTITGTHSLSLIWLLPCQHCNAQHIIS